MFMTYKVLHKVQHVYREEQSASTVWDVTVSTQYSLVSEMSDDNSWGPSLLSLIEKFMGPTWGSPGADRTQVGPMLAPWTLLSGVLTLRYKIKPPFILGDE